MRLFVAFLLLVLGVVLFRFGRAAAFRSLHDADKTRGHVAIALLTEAAGIFAAVGGLALLMTLFP